MAFESRFWRAEIKRDLSFLERKLSNQLNYADDVDLDEFFSMVEIKLFTVAYGIRKLMETGQFPDRLSGFKQPEKNKNGTSLSLQSIHSCTFLPARRK